MCRYVVIQMSPRKPEPGLAGCWPLSHDAMDYSGMALHGNGSRGRMSLPDGVKKIHLALPN